MSDPITPLSAEAGAILDRFVERQRELDLPYLRFAGGGYHPLTVESGHVNDAPSPFYGLGLPNDAATVLVMTRMGEMNGDLYSDPGHEFVKYGGVWYAYGWNQEVPFAPAMKWRSLVLDAAGLRLDMGWSAAASREALPQMPVEELHAELTAHADEFVRYHGQMHLEDPPMDRIGH